MFHRLWLVLCQLTQPGQMIEMMGSLKLLYCNLQRELAQTDGREKVPLRAFFPICVVYQVTGHAPIEARLCVHIQGEREIRVDANTC